MKALYRAKEDIEDVLLQKGDNGNLMLMNTTKKHYCNETKMKTQLQSLREGAQ
jgi:hypothetical protein